jgi:hypothetical protein
MELTWPRLGSEETAIAIVVDKDTRKKVATTNAIDREQIFRCMTRPPEKLIVVDKDTRKKVATTNAIDREQIFRCMTRPPEKLIEPFNSGPQRLFNGLMRLARFIVNCGRRVTVPNEERMRAAGLPPPVLGVHRIAPTFSSRGKKVNKIKAALRKSPLHGVGWDASWRADAWRPGLFITGVARIGDRAPKAASLSLVEPTSSCPFNALPGLTLGEDANGPRTHSVAQTPERGMPFRVMMASKDAIIFQVAGGSALPARGYF